MRASPIDQAAVLERLVSLLAVPLVFDEHISHTERVYRVFPTLKLPFDFVNFYFVEPSARGALFACRLCF